MNKIKIAYFGSPDFAADFLEKLLTDKEILQLIEVKLVITQPDQPVGRKQILTPTPVKVVADKYKIKIMESGGEKMGLETGQENRSGKDEKNPPSNFQFPNSLPNLSSKFQNLDLALVYAFGELIPKELLTLPKYGFWNIHPSLLPKYRGPSPIATPLINGDKTTGVTIIKMDEDIDHGPIIAQESYTIKDTDYRPDLEKNLTDLSFEMSKKTVFSIKGSLQLKPQNHKLATYTKKLSKQDGFVSFENLKLKIENSSEDLYNLFRGLHPWPGLWTLLRQGKRLKITGLKMINKKLFITKVQLEGKNEVDFPTFNKSYKVF